MKILIPVLNFGNSGGYRVLSKLANELIYLGHTVDFMSPDGSNEPYFDTAASTQWINEHGEFVRDRKTGFPVTDSAVSIQKKLTRALKNIDPDTYDVIIANHSLTTLPIKRAGLTRKTLYYVQAYEPDLYKMLGGVKNRLLSYLSVKSYKMKLFTVVNAEIYLKYKKLSASRVLYPGIDFNLFYPDFEEYAEPGGISTQEPIIIGTVGRTERYKGTRFIVEAYKILKIKFPTLQLHIAFGNPDDYNDSEGVYCLSPDGDAALGEYYRSLDYYICAGYAQLGGFHYPVVEAMSCGIPVITTPYFPANERNAWLIKPKSTHEIIRQFECAFQDSGLKAAKIKQALQDVNTFDWRKVGENLNNYLMEFLH